ncbi:hypothetical protein MTR_1g025630 [Medicago truncatula]|uniref:Uncharacterized protein n=1 Tax=Medicago truncatula TaxID=3880 RepID=G7I7S0_MEDTR|nr:hypothetical protein MTR_1g025630 [Medicago truncatula]
MKSDNKALLRGLKRRLEDSNGSWVKELHHVIWEHISTNYSSTKETLCRLT